MEEGGWEVEVGSLVIFFWLWQTVGEGREGFWIVKEDCRWWIRASADGSVSEGGL